MALIGIDDTAAVLEELRCRKDKDPDHFHQYEVDAAGHLKMLFWTVADPRFNSHDHTDDVVVIDTVFRTNRYGAAFVPIIGMNHHRRPVLLGSGVLTDQSPDSYVWLLRAFMRSTYQVRPKSVITDGGDAVVHAVETVLPQSNHRICSCHLERGIREHLDGYSAKVGFRSLMFEDNCSPVEFEERWHSFVARHRTTSNQEWLCKMYVKRELWTAAFVGDKFFLGMVTDQSTECFCLSSGLRTSFSEDMTLLALLRRADFRCKYMRTQEAELDNEADKSRVALTTEHECLEKDFARSFTPANFAIVLEEIEALDDFEIIDTLSSSSDGSGDKVYTLDLHGELYNVLQSDGGDDQDDVFKCSCRKMERDGLPCRHILHVLQHEKASSIPKCCKLGWLLRRGDTRHERLGEMEALGRKVFDLASQDAEEFEEIKGFLQDWLQQRNYSARDIADMILSHTVFGGC
ncbi:protein FAR1-RELATED SEQUENCE 7-like [Triticum aestivum]|uniref:protein FAR1-RELATED SEQUENCE 7-like n=1 Tax=Triticum aestivum TaxID=4565 RepID=UPI000844D93F|nr:protein FAR1-RELATED SEQUENCE 7-like [Triticum aestivum]